MTDKSNARHLARLAFGALLLLVVSHESYSAIIAPAWGYQRFIYVTPDLAVYAALVAMVLLAGCFLPFQIARPSDIVVWILYILVVVPALTIPLLAAAVTPLVSLKIGAVIALCFIAITVTTRISADLTLPRLEAAPFWVCLGLFSLATYGGLALTTGLNLRVPSLSQVYDVRANFVSTTASGFGIGYLVPAQANVVNPCVLAAGIQRRNWWMVGAAIVGELLVFSAAGYKTVLFAAPALAALALWLRNGRTPVASNLLWATSGLIVACAGLDRLTGGIQFTSLFVRRFMSTPGLLTGAWVRVWQEMPKAHFGYSFLEPWVNYPYPAGPAQIVASTYFGDVFSANANLFADGYANWGFAGMAMEAAILAVMLFLANSVSRGLPLRFACLLLLMPAITLANTSVLTTITTHGLLVALLILAFAPIDLFDRRVRARVTPPTRSTELPVRNKSRKASSWRDH